MSTTMRPRGRHGYYGNPQTFASNPAPRPRVPVTPRAPTRDQEESAEALGTAARRHCRRPGGSGCCASFHPVPAANFPVAGDASGRAGCTGGSREQEPDRLATSGEAADPPALSQALQQGQPAAALPVALLAWDTRQHVGAIGDFHPKMRRIVHKVHRHWRGPVPDSVGHRLCHGQQDVVRVDSGGVIVEPTTSPPPGVTETSRCLWHVVMSDRHVQLDLPGGLDRAWSSPGSGATGREALFASVPGAQEQTPRNRAPRPVGKPPTWSSRLWLARADPGGGSYDGKQGLVRTDPALGPGDAGHPRGGDRITDLGRAESEAHQLGATSAIASVAAVHCEVGPYVPVVCRQPAQRPSRPGPANGVARPDRLPGNSVVGATPPSAGDPDPGRPRLASGSNHEESGVGLHLTDELPRCMSREA